ncbi:MAG: hypothetical protein HY666_06235 [Chloroflexi bacterium]|nr:hypothetical protein [Chloroflexota bacterium]
MSATFSVKDVSLATRERADEIIDEVLKFVEAKRPEHLDLDLGQVHVISPSFASGLIDEIQWLLTRPGVGVKQVRIITTSPLVRGKINDALMRHMSHTSKPRSLSKVLVN